MNTNRSSLIVLIFGVFLLLLSSCKKTDEERYKKPQGDKVLLELCARPDTYHTPLLSRATADEDYIYNRPWVLVFEGNDENAEFFEVQQSFVVGYQTLISLAKNPNPCMVLVLANPPAEIVTSTGVVKAFNQDNLIALLGGQTLQYAVNNLRTYPLLASPQPSVPYVPDQPLPMYGLLSLSSIGDNTVINESGVAGGADLKLKRAVAKIVVDASAANASSMTLLGATVVNTPRNGSLAQLNGQIQDNTNNLTNYYASSGDGVVDIAPAVGNTTVGSPIYVYENSDDQVAVILKARYLGSDYYYKIKFLSANIPLDVKRNTKYTFLIRRILDVGHSTFEEALADRAVNEIVDYELQVIDLDSYTTVDNGTYYVGVSNTECYLYLFQSTNLQAQNNVNVVRVVTNAPNTLAVRDIVNTIAVPTGSMTLTNPSQRINLSTAGEPVTTDVIMNFAANFTSGTISITVGSVVTSVTINKRDMLYSTGIFYSFLTNYVTAEVTSGNSWLFVSPTNTNPNAVFSFVRLEQGPGTIYMYTPSNTTTTPRTDGVVYLSKYPTGRVKALVSQAGR